MPLTICVALRIEPYNGSRDVTDLDLCPVPRFLSTDSRERLTSFHGDCLTLSEGLELLRAASNLVRGEFHGFRDNVPSDFPPLELSKLQSLTLTSLDYDEPGQNDPIPMLLEFLTLPELRIFDIFCFARSIWNSSLLSFLQRAPNIQTLVARVEKDVDWDEIEVVLPILNVFSSLTTLTLYTDTEDPIFAVLGLLRTYETSLPRVEAMTFSVWYRFSWHYHYTEILVGALSSRSKARPGVARLVGFRLYFAGHDDESAEEDMVENDDCYPQASQQIRELEEVGMEIYIGPSPAS